MPFLTTALRWCDRNILLPITVCFLFGISTAYSHPFSAYAASIALALLFLATLIFSRRRQQLALFLSLPLFFLAGYLHLLQQLDLPKTGEQLAALLEEQSQVTVVGTLASMIEESTVQTEQGEEIISRFELEAEEVLLRHTWQSVRGRVRLTMQGRADGLLPGMSLMILAKLGEAGSFNTPGSFDYQGHLAAKDIYVSGWVGGREDMLVLNDQTKTSLHRLRSLPEQVRQEAGLFIRQHLSPEVAGVYQALLIGSQAAVSAQIQEQFKVTGTTHILSISGLHISLLALMVSALLNKLLRRSHWLLLHAHVPTLALLGTLPLLLLYSLIAGMNTPVLRSLIMAAALLGAVILRRRHDMLHLLAAAALLVLILHPLALFTASFQLSFSAVAALVLFLPQIMLPATADGSKRVAYLRSALLASLAATVGTLPLVLLHFHRFSLIGPLTNLLLEPLLCFWALPWGLAAIPCLFVWPQLASVLLKIGSLGIWAGLHGNALASALPWASIWTISPTVAEILFYGLLLLLWSLKFRKMAVAGAALLALHFTWGIWFPAQPGRSNVAVLDVGQGSSVFLQLPDGSRILVDGGSGSKESSLNIGEQVIAPYLWSQRIWRLDQAVISHPHNDHFSGMDFILAHFKPRLLWINGDAHREGKYQQILDQAVGQGMQVLIPERGRRLAQGRDFELTVVGMTGLPVRSEEVNDAALVLRYQHGRRAFLLPGDIGKQSEDILLRQGADVAADVLLAGHHGSRTSTGPDFLAAVQPKLIVVSAGRGSRQQYFPAPANRALWQEKKIPVQITREQGTVSCVTDGDGLECRALLMDGF